MAKLRPENLAQQLKQGLAPVYLVSGDESLIVQEACDHIRHAAKKMGFGERELYHSEANFDWHHLQQNLNSLSLFSEKTFTEVRVGNGKIDDTAASVISEYCAHANEDTLLLLVLPKIDKRKQNQSWYKAVEQCGHTITVWPVGPEQLPRWLDQRLKHAGLQADSAAIDILCTKIEGNLLAAVQEIEKLKLLDKKVIDAETMANAVMDSARYSVFNLVDRALAGDSRAAVRSLHGLQGEGLAPLTILWALTREVKSLLAIREAMTNGESFELAARKAGVWENRKALIRGAANRLKLAHLQMLLRNIALTDRTIKGMSAGDEWNLLLDIVLNLAGVHTIDTKTQKLQLA